MTPFEHAVECHGAMVLRICRTMLPAADADDAWSDTFLSALRAFPDLTPGSNVAAWLVTIAQRTCIDHLRRRARRAVPTATVPDTPVDLATVEPDERLRAAVAALTPQQRNTVLLHHVAGLPHADVAEQLGISPAAARRSSADGVARLRIMYQEVPR